jgi:hypothetical protein
MLIPHRNYLIVEINLEGLSDMIGIVANNEVKMNYRLSKRIKGIYSVKVDKVKTEVHVFRGYWKTQKDQEQAINDD